MTERWVNGLLRKELDMHTRKHDGATANWFELHEIAVKLLARQHRAFVRKIKSLPTYDPAATVSGMQRIDQGQWVRLDTVLAALAKQGGGKT